MSAPDTNVDRQKRRHKIPLLGMGGVIAFAFVLLAGLVVWLSAGTDEAPDAGVAGATEMTPD